MCTLTFAWQAFEDAPLVVAANRDEAVGRPSEPPARRDWERPVVAPKDGQAGGTWIGYNDSGVFAAITNRWIERDLDGGRSRGLLVRDALGYGTAEDAARFVERELDERAYEGFNLVVADEGAAVLVEWDGRPRVRNLSPGVHVVVNVGADGDYTIPGHRPEISDQQAANADEVLTELQPEPGETSQGWLDRAAAVISDHDFGVCIHGDDFGTRSSSLLHFGEAGTTYEYAPGPPCETAFERVDTDV